MLDRCTRSVTLTDLVMPNRPAISGWEFSHFELVRLKDDNDQVALTVTARGIAPENEGTQKFVFHLYGYREFQDEVSTLRKLVLPTPEEVTVELLLDMLAALDKLAQTR